MANAEVNEKTASQAVSFTVDFGEPKKKPKRLPRNLSSERLQKRQELTHESLAEKQRLAKERREKLMEDRIERIHQLEQEAINLAKAMDPLLRKESERSHPLNGLVAPPVSSEAIKAAKDVTSLNSKVVNDLVRVDKGSIPHQ